MSAKAETRLTPRERLTRGLTYSAVGPVDVTRGVVGLGVNSAQATASELRRRYQEGRLARERLPPKKRSLKSWRPLRKWWRAAASLAGGTQEAASQ